MKIAIISSTFFPRLGGAEMVMHNLGMALTHAGHDVHMIVPGSPSLRHFHPPYTLTPLTIPRGSVRFGVLEYVIMANLIHLQKKHQFDVWQVFITYPAGYAAVLAKKFMNVPVVISAQGKDIQKLPEIGYGLRLNKRVERKIQHVVHKADALVTISDAMTKAYLDTGAPADAITYIPNGIWYDRFHQAILHREQIKKKVRTELQILTHEPVLLCTARNHPKKNYPTLLSALSLLHQKGMRPHLVIAGADTEQLKSRVRELGLQDHVHLLGSYPRQFGRFDELPPQELVELYVAADMFVFPTFIEGLPVALLEAMAAGLPIVTTNVEGITHVATKDHDAVLLDNPTDVRALADAIQGVLADEQFKQHLVQNALTTAKKYDWAHLVKEFEKLYTDVIRR